MQPETLNTTTTDETADDFGTNRATYCPEDNKLRLYVGRVPPEEFLKLRAEGWMTLHKQRDAGGGDFVAIWTPERRDTALDYAGVIEDEDMGPAERAADRAERFAQYREKRTAEAFGHADRYDAGPMAHGYQSATRAERSALRHDRIAGRAVDSWGKAEYWQRRTAGVISHALHSACPSVRMGRIKELEAGIRKADKSRDEMAAALEKVRKVLALEDPAVQWRAAFDLLCSEYWMDRHEMAHPRKPEVKKCLTDLLRLNEDPITGREAMEMILRRCPEVPPEGEWLTHYRLRLAYETQMLEAQGGRAAFVEMEVGGWIGGQQIRKVNRSNATGRVVSVSVMMQSRNNFDRNGKAYDENNPRPMVLRTLNVERASADIYRPPTNEERAALLETVKAEKASAPKKDPCPLVNPTDADAERLQAVINDRARVEYANNIRRQYCSEKIVADSLAKWQPAPLVRIKQATYSAASKGAYARAETRRLRPGAIIAGRDEHLMPRTDAMQTEQHGRALCQVRITSGQTQQWPFPESVIVITDKPQKALPAAVWDAMPAAVAPETVNA